jgi:hypothetical protein
MMRKVNERTALMALTLALAAACRQAPTVEEAKASRATMQTLPSAAAVSASRATPTKAESEPTRAQRCLDEARRCGAAGLSNDYDRVVDCMPVDDLRKAFPDAGGRAGIRAVVAGSAKELAGDGWRLEAVDFDLPHEFAVGGTRLFAIVPELLSLRAPEGHFLQRGFEIGVSDDGGASWKFVADSVSREDLFRTFPEFPSGLALPEVPKPELVP